VSSAVISSSKDGCAISTLIDDSDGLRGEIVMRPNNTFRHLREQGFKLFRQDAVIWAKRMDMPFEIHTPDGTLRGEAGDYWCVAPGNRQWPMNATLFGLTYRPVQAGG
jgi:hypothetical protein